MKSDKIPFPILATMWVVILIAIWIAKGSFPFLATGLATVHTLLTAKY